MPRQGRLFSPPLLSPLWILIGLTGLSNWPRMHKDDSPTLNGLSYSCWLQRILMKPLAQKEFGRGTGVNPQTL